MANTDRPNGFTPVKTLSGAPVSGLIRRYEAADRSADTTGNHGDIYIGDAVALSSGKVIPANGNGTTILGVVVGIEVTPTQMHGGQVPADVGNLSKQYLAAADSGYVYVAPANDVLFEVQSASDLDLLIDGQADINSAANTAHGNQTTGRSNMELTTAAGNDVSVVEYMTAPDNDRTLTNARYIVKFNNVV